jgi:hypothetical protein
MSGPQSRPDQPGEPRARALCEKVKKDFARYEHPLFRFSNDREKLGTAV